MSYVASELRELRKEIVRLNRKLAMGRLPGKVVQRDAEKRLVRLELGRDPETDMPVLSPWVRVQSGSAGAFKTFVLPSIGEQLYLESASGVIGGDSVAAFGTFTEQNPPPAQGADEAVLLENGQTRIVVKNGLIQLKSSGVELKFTPQGAAFTGGKITHDGKNIGSEHKHKDVEPGGGQSGPPVP